MKVRIDFVTNSSSSSFIIMTKESPPEQYKNHFYKITSDNMYEIIKECFPEYYVSYEVDNDMFQKLGNFTDEQMAIILFSTNGELSEYKKIKEALNEAKETGASVYTINVDRDWLYYNPEVREFIDNAEMIDEELER